MGPQRAYGSPTRHIEPETSYSHSIDTTYLGERLDATANLNVVDDHTSVGVTSDGTGALSDALEGTIGRGLEIKGGRPVVRLKSKYKE